MSMFKKIALFLILTLTLVAAPVAVFAQDQKGTVQQSGIQIQNLSTETANVTVRFISSADGSTAVSQNVTIPGGASRTLLSFITAPTGNLIPFQAPAGFNGAAVIESDQPVVAIANLTNTAFSITEGYPGFSAGSNSVLVPLVVRNNPVGGPTGLASTAISVQNTGTAAANVTITYARGAAGNTGTIAPETVTLQPGQSRTFNQIDKTDLGDTTGLFIGSATVTSTGAPVAVAVTQEGNAQLSSYSAFTGGTPRVALPLVVANNTRNRDFTGLQVQNAGTAPTNLTFTFSKNAFTSIPAGNGTPVTKTCGTATGEMVSRQFTNVPAGASRTLITTSFSAGDPDPSAPLEGDLFDPQFRNCLYVGSAIVDGGGQPIVAIVNQARQGATKQASAYEGFSSTAGTDETRTPLISAGNFGLLTGVQVQNVGTSAANVTISYSQNSVSSPLGGLQPCVAQPTARTTSVAAGASFTFLQFGAAGAGFDPSTGADGQFGNCAYIGSATITAPSGQVVAVVNQVNLSPTADTLTTYNGFNQ